MKTRDSAPEDTMLDPFGPDVFDPYAPTGIDPYASNGIDPYAHIDAERHRRESGDRADDDDDSDAND